MDDIADIICQILRYSIQHQRDQDFQYLCYRYYSKYQYLIFNVIKLILCIIPFYGRLYDHIAVYPYLKDI